MWQTDYVNKAITTLCISLSFLVGTAAWSSELPPCPDSPSEEWDVCEGHLEYVDGSYAGGFKDGKYHGHGTLTLSSGATYVGEFKDGKSHGHGEAAFADGVTYVGQWEDGEESGHGTVTYPDGNTYVGQWEDGKSHGQGTWTFPPGNIYVGRFKDNNPHGQGSYFYLGGGEYHGQWRDAKKHGFGTYIKRDEFTYVGQFKDGNITGYGSYTTPTGFSYVGEFKNWQKHGYGREQFSDGSTWEGQFEFNQRHGPGTATSTTGEKTVATYVAGEIPKDPEDPNVKRYSDPTFKRASSGTGFSISNKYLVTNEHVTRGCDHIDIHHDGRVYPAELARVNPVADITILQGPSGWNSPAVFPLSYEAPTLAQDVFVAGFPIPDYMGESIKMTKGIVSSTERRGDPLYFQIDAAAQQGNSGGPILDTKGNVIGILSSGLQKGKIAEVTGDMPELVNYGIKVQVLHVVLDNELSLVPPNRYELSRQELGKLASNGTYLIRCLIKAE